MPIHFWNSRQCHVIQCKTCIHTMTTKSPKRIYKDISKMPKRTTWISDLMDCTTTILTAPANHLAPLHRLPLGWRIRIRGVWQTKVWYSWIHLPLHQLWRVSGCYQGTIIIVQESFWLSVLDRTRGLAWDVHVCLSRLAWSTLEILLEKHM